MAAIVEPMAIQLLCQAPCATDAELGLAYHEFLAWDQASRLQPARVHPWPSSLLQPGPGPTVVCASSRAALDTASKVFSDRRLEVRPLYDDPLVPAPRIPLLRFKPERWRKISFRAWQWGIQNCPESPEEVRQRVIQAVIRLTEIAKADDEAAIVAGPGFLRLLSWKLVSLGWQGPFWGMQKPLQSRTYRYARGPEA